MLQTKGTARRGKQRMNKQRTGRVSHVSDREALGLSSAGGGDGKQQLQKNKNQVLEEQDAILDEISGNLTKVGVIAQDINDTIEDQRRELDAMEAGMTRTNTTLDHVTRRTKALVDRAGGQRQCCIQVFLGVVALILLFLVIYT